MESIRVLVVEDDQDINNLLCTILRDGGYESQAAFSGSEGLLWAERENFDLVLLDLVLPGLTGEQFIQKIRHIRTMPYPGFPTDAQPLVMSMAAVGRGTSIFVETIFENRYKHAEGLQRLGANIKVEGKVAIVEGVEQLRGAPVMSHDLRGGAALVVAGLCAKGRTEVGGVEYIRRGYESLAGNLASLGARIREVGEPTP